MFTRRRYEHPEPDRFEQVLLDGVSASWHGFPLALTTVTPDTLATTVHDAFCDPLLLAAGQVGSFLDAGLDRLGPLRQIRAAAGALIHLRCFQELPSQAPWAAVRAEALRYGVPDADTLATFQLWSWLEVAYDGDDEGSFGSLVVRVSDAVADGGSSTARDLTRLCSQVLAAAYMANSRGPRWWRRRRARRRIAESYALAGDAVDQAVA